MDLRSIHKKDGDSQIKQAEILVPWKGTNGVCRHYTKLKHQILGSIIVCFYEKLFYLKYIDNKDTITLRMQISESVRAILNSEHFNFFLLRSSLNSPFSFLLFYSQI